MEPILEREVFGGVQKVFRFRNGYGASVVRHQYSRGGNSGLWELAVIKFYSKNSIDFDLDYNTPITSDVLGHLNESEVQNYLKQIRGLKKQ